MEHFFTLIFLLFFKGHFCACCLAQAGDGGGPGVLQECDRCGGHLPCCRHQQENHEAQVEHFQKILKSFAHLAENYVQKIFKRGQQEFGKLLQTFLLNFC